MIFFRYQSAKDFHQEEQAKDCARMMIEYIEENGLKEDFINFMMEKEIEKINSERGKNK